jgi:hypothetical protein
MDPIEPPTQELGGRREKVELKLLRALIDSYDRSPPSQLDVEMALQSGLARLMSLEGRLRAQASRESGRRPSEARGEDHDLIEEIRALQDAVAELRARANPGSQPRSRRDSSCPANLEARQSAASTGPLREPDPGRVESPARNRRARGRAAHGTRRRKPSSRFISPHRSVCPARAAPLLRRKQGPDLIGKARAPTNCT